MSYGSYGRYGSGYSSYTGGTRRLGASSSYLPSSYSPRRTSGGPYGLTPSYSSSYLSPNSSPRSSISSGTTREARPAYSSYKTLTSDSRRSDYSPERAGYRLSSSKSASSLRSDGSSDLSSLYEGHTDRPRQRYGSSTSIPDSSSEASYRSDTSSRYGSKASLSEDENKDYKKLYEELKKENERLKETLRKTEDELERTKKQLQKLQSSNMKNSVSEAEKKERRSLERKLSEMEEEIKNISKLKTENEKLKAENRALSRVVCKLSK
ncbi:Protein phosphatase 1 regulatory subunit 12B like protein [Argiope bruennichi]|uniref:Protein phosphatase 1 regulatory subunit 12B like protein n=1 Tax=Argiope bruennichi TaxID=94029 RepID=A0A8T0FKA7_ARGBR|nr:Protein phosphatase 1 regulatory subunit 12B like protein [Argiope bruennichi]